MREETNPYSRAIKAFDQRIKAALEKAQREKELLQPGTAPGPQEVQEVQQLSNEEVKE